MSEEKALIEKTVENTNGKRSKSNKSQQKETTFVQSVYVGTSLPMLAQFTVLKNGIPAYLNEEIKKCQAIKELIVPIEQLNEAYKKLQKKGTREYLLNTKIIQYIKGGRK